MSGFVFVVLLTQLPPLYALSFCKVFDVLVNLFGTFPSNVYSIARIDSSNSTRLWFLSYQLILFRLFTFNVICTFLLLNHIVTVRGI